MKTIKLFIYALVVCISFVGVAEAKGRSGSFKGGFASQKRTAPKPTNTPYQVPPKNTQSNNTAFGSFGGTNSRLDQKAAAQSLPQGQSQMSKDLSANAARSNALKTVDGRTKVNEKVSNENSESGWFRSGNQNTIPPKTNSVGSNGQSPQPARAQPAPQYNNGRQSSGLLPGLIGFMIGHSLAQQHTSTVNTPQNDQAIGQDADPLAHSPAAEQITVQQEPHVSVVETESFFMRLLRVVLWVVMISGVFWMVRKLMRFRNRNVQQAANYSLRS